MRGVAERDALTAEADGQHPADQDHTECVEGVVTTMILTVGADVPEEATALERADAADVAIYQVDVAAAAAHLRADPTVTPNL